MTKQGGKHVEQGKYSAGEVMDSLTGAEEDDVAMAFGSEPLVLQIEKRFTKVRRAMLFVLHRRDGANPSDAKKAALALPAGELFEFFADVDTADGPDEDTDQGKGTAEPAAELTTPHASGSASDSDPTSTTP